MIVAGVDIGAATAKAVVLETKGKGRRKVSSILPTGRDSYGAGERALRDALSKIDSGVPLDGLDFIVATGYGRVSLSFAHKTLTEIACHAKGVHCVVPSARFIIDIGGQDSKAIKLNEQGGVVSFVMNDKCAAGSGRFLEVMAGVLELDLEDFGETALRSKNPCGMSSICTVFAESEMVCLRAERRPLEDLVAGIHCSIAKRVATMAASLGFKKDIVFTGGVAKNIGMRKALEDEIKQEILVPPEDPQLTGALGAALFAEEMLAHGST